MKRIKLTVAYDGTNYCGWQIQKNGITVEEVLNRTLSKFFHDDITVIGASRTDSGVHAKGNVAVFDAEVTMPPEKISYALNNLLPDDIRIQKSEEASPDFHPRYCDTRKTYEYRIYNAQFPDPMVRLYSHFVYYHLDEEKMQRAADYLVGEHDFKSFCTIRGQSEETVRTIYSAGVTKEKDMITITVKGSGFLYNMVRIIAGTLMKVGMGVYPPEHVREILVARNRKAAGPTAPAKGLTLVQLEYETELKKKIIGKNEDWEYQLIQTEIPEKGKAYLFINRCREEDFDRLLTYTTHQAVRNGAKQVYVCDREENNRIMLGKSYGYYTFQHGHDMLSMRKPIQRVEQEQDSERKHRGFLGEWEKVSIWQANAFCNIYNQVFYSVPNSATLTEAEAREYLVNSRWYLFLIRVQGREAGFIVLVEKENELEIDSLGVLEEYQKRGLAREMLERAERMAAEMGKDFLILGVSSINTVAVNLYTRMGFETKNVTSRWYVTEAKEKENLIADK